MPTDAASASGRRLRSPRAGPRVSGSSHGATATRTTSPDTGDSSVRPNAATVQAWSSVGWLPAIRRISQAAMNPTSTAGRTQRCAAQAVSAAQIAR